MNGQPVIINFSSFPCKQFIVSYLLDVSDGSEWNKVKNCSCTDDRAFDSEFIPKLENYKMKLHLLLYFDLFMK